MLTSLKRKIQNKIYSIKKLWRWIPIIYKDRDWDYWYIYEILKYKLEDMENYIRKDGIHVYNEHDADKIKTALKLLDRIQSEYYIQEYYDTVADKFCMTEVRKALDKQQKAQRIFFKFLDHNIQKWWD
jgi:hypothetical protein